MTWTWPRWLAGEVLLALLLQIPVCILTDDGAWSLVPAVIVGVFYPLLVPFPGEKRRAYEPPPQKCAHANRLPVRSVPLPDFPEGESVAQLCTDCHQQLDADWEPSLMDLYGNPRLRHSGSMAYENAQQIRTAVLRRQAQEALDPKAGFINPYRDLSASPIPVLPPPTLEEWH